MSVLIVVAHPDDEVLGCGGLAASLAKAGVPIRACILCSEVSARRQRPELAALHEDLHRAQEILGLDKPIMGDFPNIRFNTVPHVELVQFIESAILKSEATTILTHHPSDLNNDHHHTSLACQAAARLFQRRSDVPPLKALYYMEILSSTDWAFHGHGGEFTADSFYPIGDTLEQKLQAIEAYRHVMRAFPHPRSKEIISGLAAYRGGQANVEYAEAFQTAFRRFDNADGWK